MPIEQIAPELKSIVALDHEVEELGRGFIGGEGPLWWREGVRWTRNLGQVAK